jgi:hypothetical protein
MSTQAPVRFYSVVFTDGSALRRTHVEASSLAEARAPAANIARGMMDQHEPGTQDWSTWHIELSSDEGRWEDAFPEPRLQSSGTVHGAMFAATPPQQQE